MDEHERCRPVFIFSQTRTRSNLLAHLLTTHPLIGESILYSFRTAHKNGPEGRVKEPSIFAAKEVSVVDTYQHCYDTMQQKIQDIRQKGHIPLCKDHTFYVLSASLINKHIPGLLNETHPVVVDKSCRSSAHPNPTVLPDSFMADITPVIIIRHPVRMVSSEAACVVRGLGGNIDDPGLSLSSTFKWSRIVFDYYKDSLGRLPFVIDGDEMVNGKTEDLINKLCSLIGIDGSQIQYEWKSKASYMSVDEKQNEQVYLGDLFQSTGIVRDKKMGPPVLEDEVRKWTEEWGAEGAQRLKVLAEESMEHYNYLCQFRIQ